jgi:hypothetical protein
VVGVLLQLGKPGVGDEDALLLRIIVGNGVALLMCFRDDVSHVLISQSAQDTKEEVAFGESVTKLFLRRKILAENIISHGVLVHVLDGYLLIGWHLHVVDLVLFEMKFLLAQDVSHEAKFSSTH